MDPLWGQLALQFILIFVNAIFSAVLCVIGGNVIPDTDSLLILGAVAVPITLGVMIVYVVVNTVLYKLLDEHNCNVSSKC